MKTNKQKENNKTIQLSRMLKAYPASEPCRILSNAEKSEGFIVSINSKYTRTIITTLESLDSFPFDSDITLETSLKAGSHCLHNIECTLAWKHGLEMGLEFKTGTRVGLVELQKELNGINKI